MRRDQTGAGRGFCASIATLADDVTPRKNDLLLLGGGPGFFPSGTVLDESDACLTLVDPGGGGWAGAVYVALR